MAKAKVEQIAPGMKLFSPMTHAKELHFITAEAEEYTPTACGYRADNDHRTTDPYKVTCKRCLKIMRSKAD